MYKLDYMIQRFLQDAKKVHAQTRKLKLDFEKNYPNEPLPDHFHDNFNLCTALASVRQEIKRLKDKKPS